MKFKIDELQEMLARRKRLLAEVVAQGNKEQAKYVRRTIKTIEYNIESAKVRENG